MTRYRPESLSRLTETFWGRLATELPIWYFRATLEGQEHIPREGGALLVGNHAMFGHDGVVLWSLVKKETGRLARFLGERILWKIPGMGPALDAVGAVAGEPAKAIEMLQKGELVGVYPGGIVDSFKSDEEKYQLKWGHRAGFAKVAMTARVPIVPVAAHGIDDAYELVARESLLGRRLFGSERYDLPLVVGAFGTPLPRRVTETFVVLPPIDTQGNPENPDDVERVRAETHAALDRELAKSRDNAKLGAK